MCLAGAGAAMAVSQSSRLAVLASRYGQKSATWTTSATTVAAAARARSRRIALWAELLLAKI